MLIHILSISHKLESWLSDGIEEYLKRFDTREIKIISTEMTPPTRLKTKKIKQCIQEESALIQNYLNKLKKTKIIVLDILGDLPSSTESFARNLKQWMEDGEALCFIIGGADGLADQIIQKADIRLSLSPLTFPHPMAKLILIEQIYRAYSFNKGHPYHRGNII